MQINLVTGYTGEAHIKSEDDALLNSFLAGQGDAVINLESEFNDTDCDISCDALVGGRLTRTDEAVNLTFTKPSSGYYRYDGVYIVYKKVTSGIESAELVYCEGTENASQSGAEQNIGQPTIGADVVASSVLQLYTVAWDNAQTKTVTAIVVEGSKIDTIDAITFADGETGTLYGTFAGKATGTQNNPFITLNIVYPKTLKPGQTLTITGGTMIIYVGSTSSGTINFSDMTFDVFPTGASYPNYVSLRIHYTGGSSHPDGSAIAYVLFDYVIS